MNLPELLTVACGTIIAGGVSLVLAAVSRMPAPASCPGCGASIDPTHATRCVGCGTLHILTDGKMRTVPPTDPHYGELVTACAPAR